MNAEIDPNARLRARRRPRWGTLVIVIAFHVLVLAGLVRAFAPDYAAVALKQLSSAIMVTVTTHEKPPPATSPSPDAGAAAEQGRKAKPKPSPAPKQTLPLKPSNVPPVASTGSENRSGASAAGAGPGGGGEGAGTGSGNSGNGQGNVIASKAVLISGAIEGSAKDFPIPPGGREARVGRSVIIALTIGTDGVPSACRIFRSSGLPETDQRTCELALKRLRFRAAMDSRGNPVVSTYYWQQRFFE